MALRLVFNREHGLSVWVKPLKLLAANHCRVSLKHALYQLQERTAILENCQDYKPYRSTTQIVLGNRTNKGREENREGTPFEPAHTNRKYQRKYFVDYR